LHSVFQMLEPPTQEEGFVWVKTVEQTASLPAAL